jgi:hypothetical protein
VWGLCSDLSTFTCQGNGTLDYCDPGLLCDNSSNLILFKPSVKPWSTIPQEITVFTNLAEMYINHLIPDAEVFKQSVKPITFWNDPQSICDDLTSHAVRILSPCCSAILIQSDLSNNHLHGPVSLPNLTSCVLDSNNTLECPFPSACGPCSCNSTAPCSASRCIFPGPWSSCSTPSPTPTLTPTKCSFQIWITCDNYYFAYLNGNPLVSDPFDANGWYTADRATADFEVGRNVIAIRGSDMVNGGVAASLVQISCANATFMSGTEWRVSTIEQPGWTTVNFDDTNWTNATSFGGYGIVPWNFDVGGWPSPTAAQWIWAADNRNIDFVSSLNSVLSTFN